jgi:hypothetical protein
MLLEDLLQKVGEDEIESAQEKGDAERNDDDDGGKADRFLPGRPVHVPKLLPGVHEEVLYAGGHIF